MITVRVNIPFEQYKECFVKNYQGPYIIQQKPGSPWKTVNKNISDDVILAHLDGTIWAGVRAPWYITYGIIDFDCPENDIVRKTVEHLRMRESNYLLVTSPSFRQDGSVHLIFPVEYSNALTASRYQKLFAEYMTGEFSGVEIYPHPHRPIRLPFGKDQYIIDDCGAPLDQSC